MIAETVCSAVAAAGLGIAAVTAYRKRFLTAARIAAYSLVPLGLVMTGVVDWVADTAFSPVAWAGFGVLGASWLLFAGTRAVERRPRWHPQGAQGRRPVRAGRGGGASGLGALPGPGLPLEDALRDRTPCRQGGRLQRHRGHPQEARHMTAACRLKRHSRPARSQK